MMIIDDEVSSILIEGWALPMKVDDRNYSFEEYLSVFSLLNDRVMLKVVLDTDRNLSSLTMRLSNEEKNTLTVSLTMNRMLTMELQKDCDGLDHDSDTIPDDDKVDKVNDDRMMQEEDGKEQRSIYDCYYSNGLYDECCSD